MNLLGIFLIFSLVLILEPVEEPLLSGAEFQDVYTVLRLFDFFELCITWEHIEAIDGILGVSVAPLELDHTLEIFCDSYDALASLWLYYLAIICHLS